MRSSVVVHVEHLHGSELIEHRSWGKAGCQRPEPRTQRDVKTIGQEGHEDVGLDALLELVVDRAQLQIVLHALEGGLDLDELDVELPQLRAAWAGSLLGDALCPAFRYFLVRYRRRGRLGHFTSQRSAMRSNSALALTCRLIGYRSCDQYLVAGGASQLNL